MNLLDIISSSVVCLYFIPIVLFLYTQQDYHLLGAVGLYLTTLVSEFLKYHVIKDRSTRPKGAKECNVWCNDGNQEGKPGMPSSHSAEVAFFVGFYWKEVSDIRIKWMMIIYAGLVMVSRYLKRCHTIEQIGAGTILGLLISWIVRCVKYQT
jgi:membrane-associated phospholipid phosphatase